jgi:hypothetical protein
MGVKVNLDRWLPHLEAAKHEGKTLKAYARSRGLAACTLYAARQMLRELRGGRASERNGVAQRLPGKAAAGGAFAAVKLATPVVPLSGPGARLQARLPNGVMLELAGADAALLAVAIKTLARR